MKKSVLIVEDEPVIAQEIAFNLIEWGFDIAGIAHDSEKALDLLYRKHPDIALLDIGIGGLRNGIELANIIRENYHIPFVFLTSFSDMDSIKLAAYTLAYGYLVKPYKDSDLGPALMVALQKHEAQAIDGLPTLAKINRTFTVEISSTEYKVIQLLWEGLKNEAVADKLFVTINTVKTHIRNIYDKLEVHSKPDLISKLRV